jgi:CDP-2,3-bis-(O-geranylgeranyl)-sn-glycerol synthase
MVSEHLLIPAQVLWVLTPTYIANAAATLPRGRGPPMDFGRSLRDGRRLFGDTKTWSGFLFGILFALPFGLLQAWLILIAPPDLQLVPRFGPTVLLSVPVLLLLTAGGMTGDLLGSFIKRRLGRPSGARTLLLDQLPFVLVPVTLGVLLAPSIFVTTFFSLEAILWLLVFTLGLHAGFNWIGYWTGAKRVPW